MPWDHTYGDNAYIQFNNTDKEWKIGTLVWRYQERNAVDIYVYAEWYIKSWSVTDHNIIISLYSVSSNQR
jgi:hypothetical protein